MNSLKQDFVYAFRQLRKSSGFSMAAILTFALGIGANLTVFMILYGVILRPLPFPQPEQLVRVDRAYPNGETGDAYSATKFLFMQRSNRSFQAMAAYDFVPSNVNLMQAGEAIPLHSLRATSDYFRVFQMEPELGRGFSAQDALQNAAGVVVISDSLWRRQFSADRQILGRPITLGNQPYTIIGVASPQFRLEAPVDVWMPLSLVEKANDKSNEYSVVGRIAPNVTAAQTTDDLKRVLVQLKSTYPDLLGDTESVRIIDYHQSMVGNIRPALVFLMGAVALVLTIVAANILSLLLTRSIARRREMSLRAALGASGWRILRQLLTENAVLCAAGGTAGILLAKLAAPVLLRISPLQLPEFTSLELGGPAMIFAALLTAVCALIFSIVPAIESRRTQLNDSLRVNTSQIASGRHLAQKALVISEVAISLVLLVGAALLLTSFWKLMHTSSGFQTANVLTFKTSFSNQQVPDSATYSRRIDDLIQRMEALPGVSAVAAVNNLPTQLVPDLPFDILGRDPKRPDASGDEKYIPISSHYFDALQVPVTAGRAFTVGDTQGSNPVVIVNQQFVRRYFNNENPIGQHIRIGGQMGDGFEDSVREIVGVVGDIKQEGLDSKAPGAMYLPAAQVPDKLTQLSNTLLGTSWIVRTKSPSVAAAEPIRRIFLNDAGLPLLSVQPLADVISSSVAQQRFSMILLSAFGVISLMLGMAGLYGVMSYTVARQTKEIGVRMAIGAQRSDILMMVMREAALLVVAGLLVGIGTSLAGARLLQKLVYGIAPRDPLTLALACLVLLTTGALAAWVPAHRAASTEPMQALRNE